jgi:hypothetical protein
MRHTTPFRRALFAAVAIVQMAVPAIVAVADAELAVRAAGAVQVHVEDHTSRDCRPAHPDDCALCQLLSHLAFPRATSAVVPVASVVRSTTGDDASPLASSTVRSLQRTRAPPIG